MARIVLLFSFAIVLWMSSNTRGQDLPPPRPNPTDIPGSRNEPPTNRNTRPSLAALSDFQLATWIIVECDGQNRVSRTAEQQASNEEIKQYAQRLVRYRDQLSDQLVGTIRVKNSSDSNRNSNDASANISALLDELSVRLESRDTSPPIDNVSPRENPSRSATSPRSDSAVANEIAPSDSPARVTDTNVTGPVADRPTTDAAAERDETDRAARRERLQDRLDRLGLRRDAEDREDRRDGRVRDLMRDAMPVIRQNLPEILDVLGEAVENSGNDDASLALMQFQREVAHNQSKRIVEELTRRPGQFDPGYLG